MPSTGQLTATEQTAPHVKQGLVGFFDILGYQSAFAEAEIAKAISLLRRIQETISSAEKRLRETEDFLDGRVIDYVVYADSIVIFIEPGSGGLRTTVANWDHMALAALTEFVADLLNHFFVAGFPLRGALAYGDIYVDSRTPGRILVAGRPIIEAYKRANELDLSACALACSAEDYFRQLTKGDNLLGFRLYNTPLSEDCRVRSRSLYLLDQRAFYDNYRVSENWPELSEEMLRGKFADHDKPTKNEKVIGKITNTWKFLRSTNRQNMC